MLLYIIVSFVSQKAAQFVFGTVFGLVFGSDGTVSLSAVLTSILVAVVASAFSVLAAAFTAKLYRALRDARESIVEAR
jgi:ABC-type spermidine/putrescine transport system permease subunit II